MTRFAAGLLILALIACGSETQTATHAARCQVMCDARPFWCTAQVTGADFGTTKCVESCSAQTEGLSATCAQCILSKTSWSGCVCDAQQQCLSCVEPSDAPTDCTAVCVGPSTCTGFTLGRVDGDCATSCK